MSVRTKRLVDQLEGTRALNKGEYIALLRDFDDEDRAYIAEKARSATIKRFGYKIYTRGLIEISNYCKNDCYYCGIRRSNHEAQRYRLSKEEILTCCNVGYGLGFRTFVLQGGEDPAFTDEDLVDIVAEMKRGYNDCAITLSLGERSYASYKALFEAGADRYLLRHETADPYHYGILHPADLELASRKECLFQLKEIGYQTGTGFMVGSPWQRVENLAEDLLFIKELNPHMVGIGPFLPHKDTPFYDKPAGSLSMTLFLISVLRLMNPDLLLPATTALGTLDHKNGREAGVLAGANVVMPNLSPVTVRKKYALYNDKISTGEEAAESRTLLEKRMNRIGYHLSEERGDFHHSS